jgi:hypothetical protein
MEPFQLVAMITTSAYCLTAEAVYVVVFLRKSADTIVGQMEKMI